MSLQITCGAKSLGFRVAVSKPQDHCFKEKPFPSCTGLIILCFCLLSCQLILSESHSGQLLQLGNLGAEPAGATAAEAAAAQCDFLTRSADKITSRRLLCMTGKTFSRCRTWPVGQGLAPVGLEEGSPNFLAEGYLAQC